MNDQTQASDLYPAPASASPAARWPLHVWFGLGAIFYLGRPVP
ncbi:hypothetical protein [Mesorhizobium erdmanii]|nr:MULTISPECIES: hypothetical protein [Mesorhizobium]